MLGATGRPREEAEEAGQAEGVEDGEVHLELAEALWDPK